MNGTSFKDFTNLYSLSKTLRFELKPVDETLENIKKNKILSQDKHKADSYKKVKKIIDEYHKAFIENSLNGFKFDKEPLEEYLHLFIIKSKDETKQISFKKVQATLRKEIIKAFDTTRLFGKKLIKEDLLKFADNEEDKKRIEEFKDFTTYFAGFNENRKNIYSKDEKSTAIAYRVVHENLPKFINNMAVFEKIKEVLSDEIETVYANLKNYLSAKQIDAMFKIDYYNEVLTQTQIDIYNLIINGIVLEDGTKIQGLNEYINLHNQQKEDHLPKFTPLFKQILSDKDRTISWLPEKFENDSAVLESIKKVYNEISENALNKNVKNEYSLKNLLLGIDGFDLSKIYLRNDTGLTDISQKFLGSYLIITNAIKEKYINDNPKKQRESQENYDKKIDKKLKSADSFAIAFVDKCLGDKTIYDYFKEATVNLLLRLKTAT